jgi:hypothetical protein
MCRCGCIASVDVHIMPDLRLRLMFATLRIGCVAEWVVVVNSLVMEGQCSGIFSTGTSNSATS